MTKIAKSFLLNIADPEDKLALSTADVINLSIERVFRNYNNPRVMPELDNVLFMICCGHSHMTVSEPVEVFIDLGPYRDRFVQHDEYEFPEFQTTVQVIDEGARVLIQTLRRV